MYNGEFINFWANITSWSEQLDHGHALLFLGQSGFSSVGLQILKLQNLCDYFDGTSDELPANYNQSWIESCGIIFDKVELYCRQR